MVAFVNFFNKREMMMMCPGHEHVVQHVLAF